MIAEVALIVVMAICLGFAILHKVHSNYVVVIPTFTASAYNEHGFYDYYKGKGCCLTVPVIENYSDSNVKMSANFGARIIFMGLMFDAVKDEDVSNNPAILANRTAIVLHNEYMTLQEFNALNNNHTIHFYPNDMYAQVNYTSVCPADDCVHAYNGIILVRGHGYPTTDIKNGFNWTNDNSPTEMDKGHTNFCKPDQLNFDKERQVNCWVQDPFDIITLISRLPTP